MKSAVLIDAGRHTAIRVGETKKHVSMIPMDASGLRVVKVSHDIVARDWGEVPYPVHEAARRYLGSEVSKSSDTTDEARTILEALASPNDEKEPIMSATAIATSKKAAAPVKSTAAAVKPLDGNFKIGDDSSVKRGFLREYVDHAKTLKTFTRAQLVTKFKSKEDEGRLVRYFGYAVKHGIFVATK